MTRWNPHAPPHRPVLPAGPRRRGRRVPGGRAGRQVGAQPRDGRRAADARHPVDAGRPGLHHHAARLRAALHLRREGERWCRCWPNRCRRSRPTARSTRITLRKGVKLHSGRDLDADDVVASLKRWMEVSPRGKSVAAQVADLSAKGPLAVEISLKNAYAPLLSQLAMASGMAAIMAKESLAQPLREFVGTGPYKFKERKPDQYVLLTRFDAYSARKEAASGYGGKRAAAGRGAALRAGAQRQHARRRRARRPVPLRRPAADRGARAAREGAAARWCRS